MIPPHVSHNSHEVIGEDHAEEYRDPIIDELFAGNSPEAKFGKRPFHVTGQGIDKCGQHSEKECPECKAIRR